MIKAGQDALAVDFILTVVAGETLTARDAVYIKTSDGKAYRCDASDVTKVAFVGFAQEATASASNVNIVHSIHLDGFSGLVVNTEYYISATTPGAITATAPSIKQKIGYATSATIIKIASSNSVVTFIANGTYNVPSWASMLYVEGWGGGGSGGVGLHNGQECCAAGGAGGGHRGAFIPISALGGATTVSVTVGLGGAAVTQPSNGFANGNAGGNTTFGSFLTVNGGAGGLGNASNGLSVGNPVGGTVSGGNLVVITEAGGDGGGASNVSNGSATAGANTVESGGGGGGASSDATGGSAYIGVGGTSTRAGAGGAGAANYGTAVSLVATSGGVKGGGGGGCALFYGSGSPTVTSGKGGGGLLIVTAM